MKKVKDGWYVLNHSVFLLQYHLVFVTKYRHPVIDGCLKEDLIGYITTTFERNDSVNLVEINTDRDHVHMMFEASPNLELTKLINGLKTASARQIRKKYEEELKPYYWKPYFWSRSDCLVTV